MAKRFLKSALSWLLALSLGFLAVNAVAFFHQRSIGYFPTPNGVTEGVWAPDSVWIQNLEGSSITRTDSNGFMNPDLPLAQDYVLVIGSSHTQGIEVSAEEKYPMLVSEALSQGDGKLHTYSIGTSGVLLPKIAKHFKAATQVYGDASAIVIEVTGTNYAPQQLEDALLQVDFHETQTAEYQMSHRSAAGKLKDLARQYFPLMDQIFQQIKIALGKDGHAPFGPESGLDMEAYERLMDQVLKTMRSQYEGPILILYHPPVVIGTDGSLEPQICSTWELFQQLARKHNIDCISAGDAYVAHYQATHQVPSGFLNTAPASGHINKTGHRILADLILDYLEGK